MADAQPKTDDVTTVEPPPTSVPGILARLGPGLIVAGSIVGSGELIATTKTGADAGFSLLWLILIGCVIKVFVQVEFGRYSIVNQRTTMTGLAEVPGPALAGRGNWIVWYWFVMFLASIGQLGGIVGGVGQALAISAPLTEYGRQYDEYVDRKTLIEVTRAELRSARASNDSARVRAVESDLDRQLGAFRDVAARIGPEPRQPLDDKIWATAVAVVTSVVLVLGRYRLIQAFATAMVATFTLITVANVILQQSAPTWSVSWSDIVHGMSFRLPQGDDPQKAVATALATFGIIGVGASELVTYPYWCIEKGYARFTGRPDGSADWVDRARGWMRVMRWDAWCSMVVYTFATIAFYLLGAAVLGRTPELNPEGTELVHTLSVMYYPVFGPAAQALFLFGAFAVLYSTYFVANASHARVFSDAVRVLGFAADTPDAHRRRVRVLSGLFPLLCLSVYLFYSMPVQLVLLSGLMQAMMLPMLAAAGLFFRYRRCDPRVAPGRVWDAFLWASAVGMLITGTWGLYSALASTGQGKKHEPPAGTEQPADGGLPPVENEAASAAGRSRPSDTPLPREFYDRPVEQVARDLLGKSLIRQTGGRRRTGVIVEVEAYLADGDSACHASRGRTPRTEVMFGPPGHAYVYSIHARWCLNAVSDRQDVASAVLIRAVEPVEGVRQMSRRRGTERVRDLARGPARLCEAFDIDRRLNRWDLTSGRRLWIAGNDAEVPEAALSARIGVTSAEDLLLRFYVEGNPFVSGPSSRSTRRTS